MDGSMNQEESLLFGAGGCQIMVAPRYNTCHQKESQSAMVVVKAEETTRTVGSAIAHQPKGKARIVESNGLKP